MTQDSSVGQSSDLILSRRSLCRSVGIGCAAIVLGDGVPVGAQPRETDSGEGIKDDTVKKKGICGKGTKCRLVDAEWYYNWYWSPAPGNIDAEFVPIWITEFAGLNFGSKDRHMTPADNLQFMQKVLPKLEQPPYVERYAWYSGDIATLYANGNPNELGPLGNAYRRF